MDNFSKLLEFDPVPIHCIVVFPPANHKIFDSRTKSFLFFPCSSVFQVKFCKVFQKKVTIRPFQAFFSFFPLSNMIKYAGGKMRPQGCFSRLPAAGFRGKKIASFESGHAELSGVFPLGPGTLRLRRSDTAFSRRIPLQTGKPMKGLR